jgi:cell division protein FtsN
MQLHDIVGKARTDFANQASRQVYHVWRSRFDPKPMPAQREIHEAQAVRNQRAQQKQRASPEEQAAMQARKRTTHEQKLQKLEEVAATNKGTGQSQKKPSAEKQTAGPSCAAPQPTAARAPAARPASVSFQNPVARD